MIDVHCHLLPRVDDGSDSLMESVRMANIAMNSGVEQIVVTPHFVGAREELPRLRRILERYEKLVQSFRKMNIDIRLHPGAEVLCIPETVELAREDLLPTLGHSRYVLVEFDFDENPAVMDDLLAGIARYGYVPVIAHPERYGAVIEDPRCIAMWAVRGYGIQLNKGSILGAFGYKVQKTAQWILDNGLAHLVASDAHGDERRTPDMRDAVLELQKRYSRIYVDTLTKHNPQRLLKGEHMKLPTQP